MPSPAYPFASRSRSRGESLLGGSGLTALFSWSPINSETLPSGTFTRGSIALEYDGSTFIQIPSGSIRERSAAVVSGPIGYLSEPQATNFLTDIDLTTWANTNLAATADGVNALGLEQYTYDAGVTADAEHRSFDNATVGANGNAYMIALPGNNPYLILRRGSSAFSNFACYDLTAGTITEQNATLDDAFITDLGSSAYKCEVVMLNDAVNVHIAMSIVPVPGTARPNFVGANQTGAVCHVQYENTLFSTSPIVTSATIETRESDVLDTDVVIAPTFGLLVDATMPLLVGAGNTISLIGADASAVDIIRVDENFDVIMDDGGTPVVIGATASGARMRVAYGRDASGRSASLNGATTVTGGVPGAAHEGNSFQLGATNSANQSRSIHHVTEIYEEKPSDAQLESLSVIPP